MLGLAILARTLRLRVLILPVVQSPEMVPVKILSGNALV